MNADVTVEVADGRRIVRVGGWSLTVASGSDEPLIEDEELARRLGYRRPRTIRDLIDRHARDLGTLSMRHTVRRIEIGPKSARRVRESTVNVALLTEEQALFLIAKSDTPVATTILREMINAFRLAVRGLLIAPSTLALQGRLHQLHAEIEALKTLSGGVIGETRAQDLILRPMKRAARALAAADVDPTTWSAHRQRLDARLRLHVRFPMSKAQGWDLLPIEKLGEAQCKVAEELAYAEERAELVERAIERAQQTDLFKFFAAAQASKQMLGIAGGS